ncbi:MAG TPA: hypothetical protein VG406_15250 [Isosphaeraceae bacterium]|nr:hypothetical protein [Isosphaeraceae bacterium]
MAVPKLDIGPLMPKGFELDSLTIKAPEDPDEKAARLSREKMSFVVKDLAAYVVGFLFLIVIGGYCCFVVARYGVVSPEARAVLPLITTLFGGVVGLIIGKAGK